MYTLFIDTHSELITVSFINKENVFLKTQISNRSHSVYLLPLLKELMDELKITFKDVKEILVVNGPGSFTGIRIGLSVAKTIAYSLNIKIKTISSLTCYLVSSKLKEDKICFIEDNRGFYISVMDKNNKIKIRDKYTEEIEDYKNYEIVKNELDLRSIYEYSKKLKTTNPHLIHASYIKKIEVEK